jgi:hypothetical protein
MRRFDGRSGGLRTGQPGEAVRRQPRQPRARHRYGRAEVNHCNGRSQQRKRDRDADAPHPEQTTMSFGLSVACRL